MGKLLDGEWQRSLFTGVWKRVADFESVVEPATGATLAEIGKATPADIDDAIDRAAKAQKSWAATSPIKRAELLLTAVNILDQHHGEFTEWLVREIGSTKGKAAFEIEFAKDELINAAAMPFESRGVILPDIDNRSSYATREPYGVCCVISPQYSLWAA